MVDNRGQQRQFRQSDQLGRGPAARIGKQFRALDDGGACQGSELNNGSIVTTGSANAQTFFSGVTYTSCSDRAAGTAQDRRELTNTAAATLDMDGIGAVAIKTQPALILTGGDLDGQTPTRNFVMTAPIGTCWANRSSPMSGSTSGLTESGDIHDRRLGMVPHY